MPPDPETSRTVHLCSRTKPLISRFSIGRKVTSSSPPLIVASAALTTAVLESFDPFGDVGDRALDVLVVGIERGDVDAKCRRAESIVGFNPSS